MNFTDLVKKQKDYMIKVRRFLHENPELSSKEFKTTKFLKNEVKKLGLCIKEVGTTGFVAILDTKKAGKNIGIRTDIDALPVHESKINLKQTKTSCSKTDGISHACGHDGHMAILLGAIQILYSIKDKLRGRIFFIFEEGEEIGSGIDKMIYALKDEKLDAIYGTHLASFVPTGTICINNGAIMAGATLIEMNILGKAGHGSRPDLSINPVFAGANVLMAISSAWNNQLDVTKTVTLGITQFQAGTANNVIPNKAYIGGTLRYFDEFEGKKALEVIKDVATLTAKAHKCEIDFLNSGPIAMPLINDEKLSKIAKNGLLKYCINIDDIKWFASESFAKYKLLCPILYVFVGIKNDELGSGAEHHNEKFDIDDNALEYACISTCEFAYNFCNF